MADSDRARLVDEFCKVTGIESPRAVQYLEAAGWDSNLAMSSYFEEADEEAEENIPVVESHGKPKPIAPPPVSSRIATLANLMNNDDKSEEEGQAFYAGGSERSGQQVLGPGKRKAGNQIVEEMFKAARSHGAEVVDPSESRPATTKLKAFRGAGHILGSTSDSTGAASNLGDSNPGPSHPVEICLKVWRTGFTVDGGPMRDYHDPEHKEFLDSIHKGEIPKELRHKANGGQFHLNIEDHSHEDYVPKKSTVQAFTGAGFRLGSITPPVVTPQYSSPCEENEDNAKKTVNIDESQPVTNIQIRLADGTRLMMKANHSHTVGDVRRYIVEARPEYSASVFSLMTAYPSKELTDDGASLQQENLLNAVIVQKLK